MVALTPPPWRSADFPVHRTHGPSVQAARAWAARERVELVELDPIVGPALAAGRGNPDGLHWDWPTHEAIGQAVGAAVARAATRAVRASAQGTALT